MKNLVLNMLFLGTMSAYASDTTYNRLSDDAVSRLLDDHYRALEEKKARESAAWAIPQRKKIEPIEVKTASLNDQAETFKVSIGGFGEEVFHQQESPSKPLPVLVGARVVRALSFSRAEKVDSDLMQTPKTPIMGGGQVTPVGAMFAMDFDAQ